MDFNLPEELQLLKETVRRFVDEELIPLEAEFRPEADPMPQKLLRPLQEKAKSIGLWLLDVPTEFGGAGLDLLTRCVIAEEVGRTVVIPYRHNEVFGPEVRPPLFYCNEEQKERYLFPVLRGERKMCFALTEPEAGSDPSSMQTRAVKDGDHFVINGTKRFISRASHADFIQVMVLTDPEKRAQGGITSFLVDMNTPGVTLSRSQPTMMGDAPWEIVFEDVRVPSGGVLGKVGDGFALAQRYLTQGRVRYHGAQSIGMAQRALDLMMDYANNRVTFGKPLGKRQAIQFMIADSMMEVHAARLMVQECAWRNDQCEEIRERSYMVKITCTEMASRVVDRAIQVFGGMGLTTELPLEWMYRQLRSIRITEGATEVLRWRMARNHLRRRAR
ncbi:MAG: acyl-CoA dehydrogenase family protein [Acidobacteriota bacterium]|nr:acyl-CoA dehydrogenase family protein [Acidobacteriota bacterium]